MVVKLAKIDFLCVGVCCSAYITKAVVDGIDSDV